jgi:hypothetical protein
VFWTGVHPFAQVSLELYPPTSISQVAGITIPVVNQAWFTTQMKVQDSFSSALALGTPLPPSLLSSALQVLVSLGKAISVGVQCHGLHLAR